MFSPRDVRRYITFMAVRCPDRHGYSICLSSTDTSSWQKPPRCRRQIHVIFTVELKADLIISKSFLLFTMPTAGESRENLLIWEFRFMAPELFTYERVEDLFILIASAFTNERKVGSVNARLTERPQR